MLWNSGCNLWKLKRQKNYIGKKRREILFSCKKFITLKSSKKKSEIVLEGERKTIKNLREMLIEFQTICMGRDEGLVLYTVGRNAMRIKRTDDEILTGLRLIMRKTSYTRLLSSLVRILSSNLFPSV